MKKNMLKYYLILLMTLLFCAKAMSWPPINPPMCVNGEIYLYVPKGEVILPPYTRANDVDYYFMCYGDGDCPCLVEWDNNVNGERPGDEDEQAYWRIELPLGNGAILLSLLVIGYGVFLYYRRKPLRV